MAMSSLTYILGFSVRFFQPVYYGSKTKFGRHHFEWWEGLSDTILKGDHPRTIPAKFVFNLVQRFQRRRFKCDLLSKYAQFA
jgi:hypothetical protein